MRNRIGSIQSSSPLLLQLLGAFRTFNQPGALALQRRLGGQVSVMDVPAFSTKRYHLFPKPLSHFSEEVA